MDAKYNYRADFLGISHTSHVSRNAQKARGVDGSWRNFVLLSNDGANHCSP